MSPYAPTTIPTKDICRLESEVARFGNQLLLITLANADTPELVAAAEARDKIIDTLITLGQSLGAELAIRRVNSCAACFETAKEWGQFEADRPTDLERVTRAEREALDPSTWPSYTPDPIAADLAELKDAFVYGGGR